LKKKLFQLLEVPGIEPGAFHMQSERATTALYPLFIIHHCTKQYLTKVDCSEKRLSLYGVPQGSLQVFIIILYENMFQNPELFPTQVSLSPEQSTLYTSMFLRKNYKKNCHSLISGVFKKKKFG
jgi:hypothetical protein